MRGKARIDVGANGTARRPARPEEGQGMTATTDLDVREGVDRETVETVQSIGVCRINVSAACIHRQMYSI